MTLAALLLFIVALQIMYAACLGLRHFDVVVVPRKPITHIITCELRIDGTRFRAGLTESQRVIEAFRKTQGGG